MIEQEQNQPETQAIIPIRGTERGLQVQSLDEMRRWAMFVVDSGLAPACFTTASQVIVATQYGRELGFSLMQGLRSIAVINGKAQIYGDAALALVKKSGLLKGGYSEKVEGVGDKMVAKVHSVRVAPNGFESEVKTEFTVEDAKKAGLWGKKGPWSTHPKRMLKYKARAFNLRDNFPDILMGMHTVEEMEGEEYEALPAPTCATPKRADRKPVEASVVEPTPEAAEPETTDTATQEEPQAPVEPADPETLKAMYAGIVNTFNDRVLEINQKYSLGRLEKLFVEFATFVLMLDAKDLPDADSWTVELLTALNDNLKGGLPEPILAMIPVDEPEQAEAAEDAAEPGKD